MGDLSWWSERSWKKEVTHVSGSTGLDGRSEFERDRSRILHSRAFRRLQAKTQVFPPIKKDFYRTRLTHTIECAQIGKALALRLWSEAIPDGGIELVEAACLAHDIGHPPCGHQGEEALREFIPFDGNAQNIRVLTLLEEKELAGGEHSFGLNLTRATLASIIKYPYRESGKNKEFVYDEDVTRLPLPELFSKSPFTLHGSGEENTPRPFPLLLMEWADDIAYSTHDVEDGINAGFITIAHLEDEQFLHPLIAALAKKFANEMDADSVQRVAMREADELCRELGNSPDPRAYRVKAVMDSRIDRFVASAARRATTYSDDWLYAFYLDVPPEIRFECSFLKQLARHCVFQDPRVTRLEYKHKKMIHDLFVALKADAEADEHQLFPRSWWPDIEIARDAADARACTRVAADYIAGMSDSFCVRFYSELHDPEIGSAFVTT